MNTIYRNGNIEICLQDIFNSMSPESKIDLIEDLSCEDAIIKHVTDQIVVGFTENGSSGGSSYTASCYPHGLDYARREIAKASSEIARAEIEKLEKALKEMTDQFYNHTQADQDKRFYKARLGFD